MIEEFTPMSYAITVFSECNGVNEMDLLIRLELLIIRLLRRRPGGERVFLQVLKKEIRNEYRKAKANKVRGSKKSKSAEEEVYKRIRQKYGKEGETYARRYGRSEKASALIGAGASIANSALMLANVTGRKKMNPYVQAGLLATMSLSLYNEHLR